ncbi:MAG TPA: DUF1007 family protein [Alphaproteobacteria bacterium]|nr:DUF1007 family protein [Alphaproteobacteria bacterium]
MRGHSILLVLQEALRSTAAATLLAAIWIFPAHAHPHVWIGADVALQFKDKRVAAMKITWVFDDIFTESTIEDFGKKERGKIDQSELKELVAASSKSLKKYSYFTYLQIDGKRRTVTEVQDFTAEIADGLLVYHFTVPVDPPVDPRVQPFEFLLYDETYYVYLAMAKGHKVTYEGDAPADCKETRSTDTTTPLYFGYDYPTLIRISCK